MNAKDMTAGGGEFLIHTTDGGRTRVRCLFRDDTLWLTETQMAELYRVSGKTISEHLINVYDEEECEPERTIRKFRIVQPEGERQGRRLEYEQYAAERRALLESEGGRENIKALESVAKRLPAAVPKRVRNDPVQAESGLRRIH